MAPNFVSHQWIGRLGIIGGLALALTACPEDASDITESASAPSFDFTINPAFVEPAGPFTIDRVVLADVDTSVSDAFARATTQASDSATFFTCGGACPAWEFAILNSTEDARLPALQDDDASGDVAITPDSVLGAAFVILTIDNLDPNTTYTFALERLGTTVNGGLDHSNQFLNDPSFGGLQLTPDAPDELAALGGSPGTTLGSNPFEVGGFTTDADGSSGFNFFSFDGGGANDIVETNTPAGFDLPQYNYLVLYEGAIADGVPVMRSQYGVELDAGGDPVNNALGPFPTAALTAAEVLAAPGGAGRPDSLSVTFNNLEALVGGAVYEAWLVNPGTGSTALATGTYNLIKIVAERDPVTGEITSTSDSLVSSTPGVSSFVGGNEEDGFRHQLILSDATLAGGAEDTVGLQTHLVLTIASASGGGTPADSRPLWLNYTDQNSTPDDLFDDSFNFSGATSFGNFDIADAAGSRIYNGEGGGLGGFRGDILSVDLEAMSRPPLGYEYAGWLVRLDGSAFRLPDITGPPPELVSLVDADLDVVDGLVTETGILEANFRVVARESGIDFKNFRAFVVTVEPKAGDPARGPIQAQAGAIPARVFNPPE